MKYVWEDLPEKKNCFTVRSAVMVNLNTGKIVRHYSANTKIVVVQKCVTPEKTYYRTSEAAYHYLNYAFEASAFGLPNEKAPLAHSSEKTPQLNTHSCGHATKQPVLPKKQKCNDKTASSNNGERKRCRSWLRRIFRRNK